MQFRWFTRHSPFLRIPASHQHSRSRASAQQSEGCSSSTSCASRTSCAPASANPTRLSNSWPSMAIRTAAAMPGFPICAIMAQFQPCIAAAYDWLAEFVRLSLPYCASCDRAPHAKSMRFRDSARRSVKHGIVCATSVLQFPVPSSNSRYSTSSRQVNAACAEALGSNVTNRALQSSYSTREIRASKSFSALFSSVSPAIFSVGFHAYCAPNIMPGTAMRGSLTCPKSPKSVTSMPSAPQSRPYRAMRAMLFHASSMRGSSAFTPIRPGIRFVWLRLSPQVGFSRRSLSVRTASSAG